MEKSLLTKIYILRILSNCMLIKEDFARIINYVFNSLLVVYLILLLFNQLFSWDTNNVLSLNYLLILVIVFGIIFVFTNKEEKLDEDEALKIKRRKKGAIEYKMESYSDILSKDYTWLVYVLGIIGFLIIKLKTYSLGWLSWVISIVAGILIILLSLLILEEDEDEK